MDTVSMVLYGLMMATLVVLIAPRVLAANRGNIMRNIAIWLAIVLLLAILYRQFAPHTAMEPDAAPKQEEEAPAPESVTPVSRAL